MMKKLDVKSVCWQVIINPNAFAGKCMRYWADISVELQKLGINYKTHEANHANAGKTITEYLCRKGEKYFIVLGGDGTLNEIINGIFSSEVNTKDIYVVPFPLGTGNDWAQTHRYPKNYTSLFTYFMKGNFGQHDVGLVKSFQGGRIVDSRYFINIAGFGFDAAVINATAKGKNPVIASGTYLLSLLKVLMRYKAQRTVIKMNDIHIDKSIFTIAVGIGKYNGNGMKQVPMADPFDGFLDVVVIRDLPIRRILPNVKNLFSGKHVNMKEVSIFKAQELQILADPYTLGEVEGEMLTTGNYKISILPGAVNTLLIDLPSEDR